MAFLAAALPWISATTTILGAGYAVAQGQHSKEVADAQAEELRRQSIAEQAASQREALNQRRQVNFAQSRLQAVAAASGAGASDPSVANLQADLAGEGEYRYLTALYQGNDAARSLNLSADTKRAQGRAAQTAGYLRGASTILSGGEDFYSKYGNGQPGVTEFTPTANYMLDEFTPTAKRYGT